MLLWVTGTFLLLADTSGHSEVHTALQVPLGFGWAELARYGRGTVSATTYWMAGVTKYSGTPPRQGTSLPLSSMTLPHQPAACRASSKATPCRARPCLANQRRANQKISSAAVEIWGQDAPRTAQKADNPLESARRTVPPATSGQW